MSVKSKLDVVLISNILALFISVGLFGLVSIPSIVLSGVSIFLLYFSSENYATLIKKENVLYGVAIVLLLFNIVGSILTVWAVSDIEKKKKKVKKEQVDPEIKKLDMFLKLGIVLISVAGFLFATSSWARVNYLSRIFIFILGSIILFAIYRFSKNRVGIKSSAYVSWTLGMIFILFAFLSAGYAGIFGNWFSLLGAGRSFYYVSFYLLAAFLTFISYCNFEKDNILYILYTLLLLAIFQMDRFLALSVEDTLFTIAPLFILLGKFTYYSEKFRSKILYAFSKIITLISMLCFVTFQFFFDNYLSVLILTILFVYEIYSWVKKNEDSDLNYFAPLASFLFVIPLFLTLNFSIELWALGITVYAVFVYLVALLYKRKLLITSSLITADILTLFAFILSLHNPTWLPIIISVVSMFMCLACMSFESLDEYAFEAYIHPVKVFMFVLGFLLFFNNYFAFDLYELLIGILFLISVILYGVFKNKKLINMYKYISLVLALISVIKVATFGNIYAILLVILTIIGYYYVVGIYKKDDPKLTNVAFAILLFTIYLGSYAIDQHFIESTNDNYIVANVIALLLYMISVFYHDDDKTKKNITLVAIAIPIYSLIDAYNSEIWNTFFLSVLVLYLTFVINKFVKNKDYRQYIAVAGSLISVLIVMFDQSLYLSIYAIVLSIGVAFFGFVNKKYDKLFLLGIALVIVNILYNIYNWLEKTPISIFLLVIGLFLIIFASYRELTIEKKKTGKKKTNGKKRNNKKRNKK